MHMDHSQLTLCAPLADHALSGGIGNGHSPLESLLHCCLTIPPHDVSQQATPEAPTEAMQRRLQAWCEELSLLQPSDWRLGAPLGSSSAGQLN